MVTRTTLRSSAATLALAIAAAARADDVYKFGANGQPPLQPLYADVTVLRADDDKLYFRTRGGNDLSAGLGSVFYVDVANDAVFTAADRAYATRDYDEAIDGYAKVMRAADASWKVRYAAPRMLDAAGRAKRFDAAIDAWIALARVDPKAASTRKPTLPPKGSRYLDDAATSLDAAARTAAGDASRQAILGFLLDVQTAREDPAAAGAIAEKIGAAGAAPGDDPKANAVAAELQLAVARAAMQARKYDAAIATINAARPLLAEPGQQAEALFLVAEAKAALADASGDVGARRDAAIAYLRIVAHLSAEPSATGFVTRSFLAAARLQASVGDVAAARLLYDQLRGEYPDSPAAVQATALAAKLPTTTNDATDPRP